MTEIVLHIDYGQWQDLYVNNKFDIQKELMRPDGEYFMYGEIIVPGVIISIYSNNYKKGEINETQKDNFLDNIAAPVY